MRIVKWPLELWKHFVAFSPSKTFILIKRDKKTQYNRDVSSKLSIFSLRLHKSSFQSRMFRMLFWPYSSFFIDKPFNTQNASLLFRYKMGKYNQSLEIFLKAESYLESPDHEVYHFIGELLFLNAKHTKSSILDAKEYFKRSIMCGKQIHTYKTLARIYRKEKDFLKAIELLESCLKWVSCTHARDCEECLWFFSLKRLPWQQRAANRFRGDVSEGQRSW